MEQPTQRIKKNNNLIIINCDSNSNTRLHIILDDTYPKYSKQLNSHTYYQYKMHYSEGHLGKATENPY